MVPLVSLILAALGAAIAFAPSWDSFTLLTSSGASQTVTAGNAFANPGAVITGDVLVMIALVAVVVVAALWRPLRLGAALALGAAIPMVAQAISAIIQVSQPTSPLQFGISSAEAARLGLTIHSGLTPMFWVYCAFLGTLILLCAWMLLAHGQAVGSPAVPGERLPGSPAVGQPPSTPAYPGAADGPGSPTGPPTTGGAASSAGAPSPVGTVPAAGSAAGSESGAP